MVDLHIRVHGYRVDCLERGVSWLVQVATFCGLEMRVSHLPRQYHTISVLQSPHVNKKSWEQFVEITRGRGLYTTCDPQRAQILLYLVEQAHIPGVEVSLSLCTTHAFILYVYTIQTIDRPPRTRYPGYQS